MMSPNQISHAKLQWCISYWYKTPKYMYESCSCHFVFLHPITIIL